ncbi:MAG: hypothetical protein ABI823_08130 [Bryobacteraceae bacterium]
MELSSIGSLSSSTPAPVEPPPKTIKDAASQFEALLLQQMLRSVREACDSDTQDQAAANMKEYAEQNLSQLLAKSGGLGLGALLARGLEPAGGTNQAGAAKVGQADRRQ